MAIDWSLRGKHWRTGVMAFAMCALLLASCGGGGGDGDTPGADVSPTATGAPARPTPTPLTITMSDVVWTTAVDPETREPQDAVTSFPTDAPVIIAAVQLGSVPANVVLTATWSIDGVEVPAVTMQATTENALKEGWATFRFMREGGHLFPLGKLDVRITASDGTDVTGSVDIVLPQG